MGKNHVLRAIYFVVAVVVVAGSVAGQTHDFRGVARIESANGWGTGFVAAATDSQVEIWSAGHVCENVGTTAIIIWSSGERTKAIVARKQHDEDRDFAKLVGDRPDQPIAIVRLANGLPSENGFRFHVGYGDGGRQSAKQVHDSEGLRNRQGFRPHAIPGDSGGPILNQAGECFGVVVERTHEGDDSRLLALPIGHWSNSK